MNKVFHPADQRGQNRLSWLNSHHSFSFGHYHDSNKMNFGALRVFNDDVVAPGKGFGNHPHDNMEIISIPLSGALEHTDSIGNKGVINSGDVQIMSAGTGIMHSEKNASDTEPVAFFQIWIFPRERQILPRYDQKTFDSENRKNQWQILVDPQGEVGVRIVQEAWISIAEISEKSSLKYYRKRSGNGVYFFLIAGKCIIAEMGLSARDAIGIWDESQIDVAARENSTILAVEVPMSLY